MNEKTIQNFTRPLSGMPLCVSNLTLLLCPSFCSPHLLIFWLTLVMCRAAFQGILEFHSFTRPSRAAMSVGTSLFTPSQTSHHGGVNWGESLGTGRLPSSLELLWQKRDLLSPVPLYSALICSLPEVGLWVRYGIRWHGLSSLYLSETERWTFQVHLVLYVSGSGFKFKDKKIGDRSKERENNSFCCSLLSLPLFLVNSAVEMCLFALKLSADIFNNLNQRQDRPPDRWA